MIKSNIAYACYDPEQYSTHDVAELVVNSNIWADHQRRIVKDFETAVKEKWALRAKSEWVAGFNHAASNPDEHPLFSSYIAIAGNQPIGFVATGHDVWDDSMRTGEVKSLAIHPEYWGQGIGTYLLTAAELFLQSKDCRRMTLCVEDGNDRAIRLYQKAGWKKVEGVCHSDARSGRLASFFEFEKAL